MQEWCWIRKQKRFKYSVTVIKSLLNKDQREKSKLLDRLEELEVDVDTEKIFELRGSELTAYLKVKIKESEKSKNVKQLCKSFA